jgi:hypothetical protein
MSSKTAFYVNYAHNLRLTLPISFRSGAGIMDGKPSHISDAKAYAA